MEGSKKYPSPLYEDGKSPLMPKSLNHNCQMGNFARVREAIGIDAWEAIKETKVGIIPKLVDSDYIWSAKTVHYFLTRQLRISSQHEIWALVGGQPIRFSLHEFTEITGLESGAYPEENCAADYRPMWELLGVPKGAVGGPKFDELAGVFGKCRGWEFQQRMQVGLLCILHMGIHGLHHNSRLPMESAKRVFRIEDVDSYPWGRVAFKDLMEGIKKVGGQGNSYTVPGCVHALQFWAYESVTVLGEALGRLTNPTEIPFLRWGGSRPRKTIESFIADEIAKHGQVRVRKMVIKPVAEIYPDWGSEDNDQANDPELHQLICDILDGNFDERFWDVRKGNVAVQTKTKHKAKRVADDVEPPKKKQKQKGKKGSCDGDFGFNVDDSGDKAVGLREDSEAVDLIVRLYDKFDAMEASINELVHGIGDRVVSKVREEFDQFKSDIEKRVSLLETGMKELRTRKPYQPPEDNQEFTSLIHMQNQPPSPAKAVDDVDSDFVVQEVVADKFKFKTKKKRQERKKTEVKKEVKRIVIKARDDCNKGFVIPHLVDTSEGDDEQPQEQPQPQPQPRDSDELADITEKVRDEDNKLLSQSEETEEERIRCAQLSAAFDGITSAIQSLDPVGSPLKKSYPPPPPYPAIGHSGLTYMRKHLVPSKAIYDPLKLVDPLRKEALTNYLRPYEYVANFIWWVTLIYISYDLVLNIAFNFRRFPLDTQPPEVPSEVYFYRVLITPRAAWPEPTYGWLGDDVSYA